MGSKKSNPKAKEPIKVRFKDLKTDGKPNGNKSVYLDFYRNGKREYEFLKLYIKPERTAADKLANDETMRTANAVKAQKIVELQNAAHGFSIAGGRSKMNVIDYIKDLAEKKRIKAGGGNRSTKANYLALARQIEDYSGLKTTFRQVDKKYCLGFVEHLKTAKNRNNGLPLNENTQAGYVQKFGAVLNAAISDEVTSINPFKQIKPENKPKFHKTEIIYLTNDEVKTLEKTECLSPRIKHAFLFSCYTGLRFSDVQGLTWGKLQKINGGIYINYVQKKTKKHDILPVPKKALEFLPERRDATDTDRVFDLPSGGYTNIILKSWSTLAGLKKHLTFHVARRSCATNLLTLGASMEQVSGVLAHADIKITQAAYGVIETKLKRDAMNLFDKLNGLTD